MSTRSLFVPARLRTAAALTGLALLAVGCGGSEASEGAAGAAGGAASPPSSSEGASAADTASASPSTPEFPLTIRSGGLETTVPEAATSIVSLSPTATEILFAIDAGDRVAAVDNQSNHPDEAPTTDLSGLQPNVEAILEFDPDLVVVSNDVEGVAANLTEVDVPVLLQPAAEDLKDTYTQIEQLGAVTGHVGEAAELVADMQAEIDQLVADAPDAAMTYYHELDSTYYTLTSDTFAGAVYDLFGLDNIADEAGAESQYPQLSAEAIIQADPDIIFLADTKCCDVTAESVAQRDGWDQIAAVRQGAVVELDDDVASRWGPRVVEFVRSVSEAVRSAVPAG